MYYVNQQFVNNILSVLQEVKISVCLSLTSPAAAIYTQF